VKFQVFTAANIKMAVFWKVTPCSLVQRHKNYWDSCCLNLQSCARKMETACYS